MSRSTRSTKDATDMDSSAPPKSIALVLSGGGIRAMVFHLGVLKHLAENDALHRVSHISSVSGGSLVVGLMLELNGLQWPTSRSFLDEVLPRLRERLCARSLQWGALRELIFKPRNWRFMLSRANVLASALRTEWAVHHRLAELPKIPKWSINGTNAENGRRFRFKRDTIGDYKTGYASPKNNFPLASAMAVSAAFPGGFGPLTLRADQLDWQRRDWDAPVSSAKSVPPSYKRIHLYDGGVYDNLGLEAFFDAGKGTSKHPDLFILVSDAGRPLQSGFSRGAINPFRLKRVLDITSDQAHGLRVRTFVHFVENRPNAGAYLYIASKTAPGISDEAFVGQYPTTLRKVTELDFDRIAEHGYRVAKASVF